MREDQLRRDPQVRTAGVVMVVAPRIARRLASEIGISTIQAFAADRAPSVVHIQRWPLSSTALDDDGAARRLHIAHPFHPCADASLRS